MPIEERFITFNLDEVYQAIATLCEQEKTPPPPDGTLRSIDVDVSAGEKQERVTLHIEKIDGSGTSHLEYDRRFFAVALIMFCIKNKIPLPRAGTKLLKFLDDRIIMKVELN